MKYDDRASQRSKPKIVKKSAVQPASLIGRLAGAKDVRLVFFGNERLATGLESTDTPVIKSLIKERYRISAIVSNYTEGHSRNARKLEIAEVAKKHNIPLLLPERPIDIKEELKNLNADAAILIAYGRIIPQEIINIFPKGIINIHPSLLPKYRGPTPIEQTILDGVRETGVSIMKLTSKMDAGPVYASQKLTLEGTESKAVLAQKLLSLGSELLANHLPEILEEPKSYTVQDESGATYTKLLHKEDGLIDWDDSAETINCKIRAYQGFPKSKASILNQDIVVTKSRVAQNKEDGDLIQECQPGFLEILELIGPSGRKMSGADFLRGYSKN